MSAITRSGYVGANAHQYVGENAHQKIAIGLRILSKADPSLLTQENFTALIASEEKNPDVGFGLEALSKADPKLLTQANFDALIASGKKDVSFGLMILSNADPSLLTQANFDALIASEAAAVVPALGSLHEDNLVTQANFDTLIKSDTDAVAAAWALRVVNKDCPSFVLSPEDRDALIFESKNERMIDFKRRNDSLNFHRIRSNL